MMSINVSTQKTTHTRSFENRWDEAISDAQRELATVDRRRKRLQMAIRLFRRQSKEGVPWPGDKTVRPLVHHKLK